MRVWRIARWVLLSVLILVVLLGAAVYGLICHRPPEYQPAELSQQEQDQVAVRFMEHVTAFGNDAGAGLPFEWTITEQQANAYLASVDAIAALGGRKTRAAEEIRQAGLAAPAIALREGVLTLMAESVQYGKIVSIDVAFDFNERGEMTGRLKALRVGALPVPLSLLQGRIGRARDRLSGALAQVEPGGPVAGGVPLHDLSKVLGGLLDALSGTYIRPELVWHLGARHRVLVDRITIEQGQATLHMVPVARGGAASSGRP